MRADPTPELKEVLSHYDLGELVQQQRDQRGTVNTSYFIETLKDGARRKYFLRKYKRGIRGEEVLFEHSLIEHVVRSRTCPVAGLHPTRKGQTFLVQSDKDSERGIYAIFDFLPGEDRYTWIDPRLSRRELRNAGALLAHFHRAAASLAPQGRRAEAKIVALLDAIHFLWAGARERSKGTVFDAFLGDHFDLVRRSIAETHRALKEAAARRLPEMLIHSDYHPGNLKFEGEEITGLVDFDWSKVDLRAFDVGLAAWYFCVSWEGAANGRLRLTDTNDFLAAYQQQSLAEPGLPPLSFAELRCLPHFINAGNAYVIYWTLRDYFHKDVDPKEYLLYLKHTVAFARWFDRRANRKRLGDLLASLR